MAGSESSLAAAEQPEVWCEVELESVLAAEVAHLPGPAVAASASQGDAIPAASSDGSYPASGIAGDGASVPQQARSFLRQAYALISRLKGAPSAAQPKAAAEPQPQEQVAAAGAAAAAAGALAPMQPPRPLPLQPLPAATLAAPTAAGREAQWQSSAPAGAGAFLQQVSNHLVKAGGHTELQAQGAQQQAAWALWQQDVMSQQRSRKPPGLAAAQLLQQQQQQHTWQAQAALAAGLYKLPAPGQQYEQQQAGAWLTSTQSPAGAPVSTTWAVPQLLRATAGGLAGAAARAPPRPPLLAAPPFDTRGYAALAGHGITSSSRGGSSRPIGSKAAPVAAKPEAPRTLEGSYVHAARLAKVRSSCHISDCLCLHLFVLDKLWGLILAKRPPKSTPMPPRLQERAAREEAERQRLRQQGEVLKAAAKRRLKEQQEQGKQVCGSFCMLPQQLVLCNVSLAGH